MLNYFTHKKYMFTCIETIYSSAGRNMFKNDKYFKNLFLRNYNSLKNFK